MTTQADGVKRYDLNFFNSARHENPKGDYVLHEDYAHLKEERDRLLAFVRYLMRMWPEGCIDSGDMTDRAMSAGLLTPTRMTEPCDPDICECAEFGFPATCYRKSPLLTGIPAQEHAT